MAPMLASGALGPESGGKKENTQVCTYRLPVCARARQHASEAISHTGDDGRFSVHVPMLRRRTRTATLKGQIGSWFNNIVVAALHD